jgi:hypothetical protein
VTVEKLHNGALRISIIHDGRLVSQVFYFYSRREALALFKAGLKDGK